MTWNANARRQEYCNFCVNDWSEMLIIGIGRIGVRSLFSAEVNLIQS